MLFSRSIRGSALAYKHICFSTTPIDRLEEMEKYSGGRNTVGLKKEIINKFLNEDPRLSVAIDSAHDFHRSLRHQYGHILRLPESRQITTLQSNLLNFYQPDSINPYVSMAACGPWIITSCGAVVHDNGGYGMLGLGHSPDHVVEAIGQKQVMANIMTANFWQQRFTDSLNEEVGHTRQDESNPYHKYMCLNSGSELVTLASRICDANTKHLTEMGGRYYCKKIKLLGLKGGFHGRTERPAQASDSSANVYQSHLASFHNKNILDTVEPNDIDALIEAFASAERKGVFYEAMLMEPVMGEGDPGKGITPEFYSMARKLTDEHGCLLIVDSIQAGLRAHGVLSIVDYPGFSELDPPDMETFSKAINAGQYPLSVLALSERAASMYVKGIYGNTMTANPRALAVGCSVLNGMTDDMRKNIVDRGDEFLDRFTGLANEFSEIITKVQGTGLLLSIELDSKVPVTGFNGLESHLRRHGLGVIHGGMNSLRFTPNFDVTTKEVDLVTGLVRDGIMFKKI